MISTPDPSVATVDTPESVESVLGKAFREGRLEAWTQGPLEWIVALVGRLGHIRDIDRRQEIAKMLEAATDMIVLRRSPWAWRKRFSDWWNGTRIEAAWALLEEAAIRFVEHADAEGVRLAMDDAVGFAETLPADDPMRVRYEEMLAYLGEGTTGAAAEPAATGSAESKPGPTIT